MIVLVIFHDIGIYIISILKGYFVIFDIRTEALRHLNLQ